MPSRSATSSLTLPHSWCTTSRKRPLLLLPRNVAKKFSSLLKCKEHKIIDISFLKNLYGNTNVLTNLKSKIPDSFDYSIVVPLRNTIFITLASIWATSLNISLIVYGAHVGDKRYPDCRPSFARSLQNTLALSEIDGIKLGIRKKWREVVGLLYMNATPTQLCF